MTAKRCWECNTTFYSDFGAIYCNVCNQAIKNREHSDRQIRQDRWQAEQAQREAARIQAQHTQALINAENRRIAAINHQTRVISESAITTKYAYDRGHQYIDDEFGYNNPAELKIEVNEYGALEWKWNQLYITDRLNSEFKKGLGARLNQYPNIYDTIRASATRIGTGNADGSFPSTYFTLYTGLRIGGVDINTKGFKSYFTSTLDEVTGELKMNWNEPFKNADLNQAYKDGVNAVYWVENTDEKKNYRLKFEVPAIQAERSIAQSKRRLSKLYTVLIALFPFLAIYIAWNVSSGFVFGALLAIIYYVWKFLKKTHLEWKQTNAI